MLLLIMPVFVLVPLVVALLGHSIAHQPRRPLASPCSYVLHCLVAAGSLRLLLVLLVLLVLLFCALRCLLAILVCRAFLLYVYLLVALACNVRPLCLLAAVACCCLLVVFTCDAR